MSDASRPSHDASFVGRGFFWPMQVDHTGSIRLTDGAADIDAADGGGAGHRARRAGDAGRSSVAASGICCSSRSPPNLLGLMAQAVRDALAQWEPRVEVEQVDPVPDRGDPALVTITVGYRVKATNDRRNLVYPFYVIPHEEG